jgi:hypothetical protein
VITATEQQILTHLKRKEDEALDVEPISNSEWWQMKALELLLRHQLELRTELRNAGILR